ncbi:MAG TPA: hypothetical protein PLV68_17090 [Ilumatobacteraceae bacterium]|nr:hypothetical protein [Ilumatobacteraceae bacterium]
MSLKSRIGWLVNGSANTHHALTQLGEDLRALQAKVDGLAERLATLEFAATVAPGRADVERLDEAIESMRVQLRVVTDDLGDRVGAVAGLLNQRR